MFKGISRRWLINTFGVVLAIIVLLVIATSIAVHFICYSTVESSLMRCSDRLSTIFPEDSMDTPESFIEAATAYAADFDRKNEMEVQVISTTGVVIASSTGFTSEGLAVPDYSDALSADNGVGRYVGKSEAGEKIMSVTRVIKNAQGTELGAIRYVSSLRKADSKVAIYTFIAIGVGLLIIAAVALSGVYFIRSIVRPVRQMTDTAQRIAQGDFTAKVDKMYNDEIGDLSDSINDMARELDANEKLKNDFISRVSHELRTPLTAIKGWAETMQYGVPDRVTLEKGMSVIVKESSRLTSLVEELLDFSKLQSGRLTMQMERMDILAEIDEAVYMLKERALSEGKHLPKRCPSSTATATA